MIAYGGSCSVDFIVACSAFSFNLDLPKQSDIFGF